MDYLDFLPIEIKVEILVRTEPIALIRLSRTSTQYRKICTEEYNYVWKILVFKLIHPMYNYRDMEEFNKINGTQFRDWYETYIHFSSMNYKGILEIKQLVVTAAGKGNLEELNYLITLNAHDPDDKVKRPGFLVREGVIEAARKGRLNAVMYLENLLERINPRDKHDYALVLAAENGHVDVVKYLMGKGLNIHTRNDEALIFAVRNGHLEVVKYLLGQGADIHARNDEVLIRAVRSKHLEVVKYLVSQGARINANNDAALRLAARNGNLDMVKYLVNRGANIHAINDEALRWSAYSGHVDVVKYLVNQGANIHAKKDQALRRAAEKGHLDVVKYLVSEGVNIHANDDRLKLAGDKGHLDVVEYLRQF